MIEKPAPSLQHGALGQREVIFQALSHLRPVVGIILIGPVIAAYVGASTPLLPNVAAWIALGVAIALLL